ncbi:membrane protein insertase YidC [Rhodobacteraceae bacterium R_SAG10]|nr:membrane protein insertase YidC [Rhodobacteraceae bacterium R_SAG10]
MDDQNRNLILATALSFLVILVWFLAGPILFPDAFPTEQPVVEQNTSAQSTGTIPLADRPEATAPAQTPSATAAAQSTLESSPRIQIDTPSLSGSISLVGGRIDDLSLKNYRETLDPDSATVKLLKPVGEPEAYYALFGWVPGGDLEFSDVPGSNTEWELVSGVTLTPNTPVHFVWKNTTGLTFRRTISVDENFLFTITQEVTNGTNATVRVAPYSELIRAGEPSDQMGFFIIHEGAIRNNGEEREEFNYKKLRGFDPVQGWGENVDLFEVENNGWTGFTDHYWMATLIPAADQPFTSVLQYNASSDEYRSVARLETQSVLPGQTVALTTQLFAGAKEWETIRNYENRNGIPDFLNSIDWGIFFFLTKPIFAVLHWLNGIIGNMGWSIIALTLTIKAILFPLAYKSYVSMARMKELQPEMEKLKESAGDDKQKLQKEIMALYKTNKVNPASGCLPILLQIPIFFSLYKVIFVTLELRQAPWIWWIQDLSAPDPSSILNLFGLLPYDTPDPSSFMFIMSLGVLPIFLGVSMWLQQKLNPTPTDSTQAMIFAWMPWVFMFMLGRFASGLVLYWIANNTITFIQQYAIMRSHGHKPDVFGNIRAGFNRKKTNPK